MSSLNQYIDLYRETRDLISRNSAEPMNGLREEALRSLEAVGLPPKGSEDYEHTDLEAMLAPDFGLNLNRVDIAANPALAFRCGVPSLSSALYLCVNDSFAATESAAGALPEGMTVCSLREAAVRMPEVLKKYYGSVADMANPVVSLNSLFAQDGIFIHVARGVRAETPVQIVNILNNGMPLMAVRRMLVVLEEDSEARILLCDHTQNPDLKFLSLQTIEIVAGRHSRLDVYDLEESTPLTSRLSSLWLRQEEGSNVLLDGITLFNGTTRNEYHCVLAEPHSELRLLGMGIEDGARKIETYSHIAHESGHCHADELMKFTVDDDSTASFTGRIYVAPGSVKTEAYQSNRNIVSGDRATVFSKPQLEIYNDDVKCSHGTATGQLDPMQLFYMRTRGLDEATARLLLKQAFMADVIEGVRLPALKDRLHILVERRFAGERSSCSHCGTPCAGQPAGCVDGTDTES